MDSQAISIVVNIGPTLDTGPEIKIAVFGTPLSLDAASGLYEALGAALTRAEGLAETLRFDGGS